MRPYVLVPCEGLAVKGFERSGEKRRQNVKAPVFGGSGPTWVKTEVTPAFCAVAVVAGGSAMGLLLLLLWCVAMAAAITGVERLPVASQTVAGGHAESGRAL
jgi:hypothetical protein